MTKKQRILSLLQERAGIGLTALESLQLAGTMRLAASFKNLRDDGYSIDTELIETPGGDHVARYRLVPTADDGTPLNEVMADGISQVMDRVNTNGMGGRDEDVSKTGEVLCQSIHPVTG